MYSQIRYEVADGVGVMTLARPEYRNAQNVAMLFALDEAFGRAVDDLVLAMRVLMTAPGPRDRTPPDPTIAPTGARPFSGGGGVGPPT